uniref:Uncharacterized protein n=1 Tax=Myotis myotis TaxID=51298 RepID=A0A7J7VIL7_MYOMY|nr:hypothetical protein mMyoMyo1_008304 [Myotis myotis]
MWDFRYGAGTPAPAASDPSRPEGIPGPARARGGGSEKVRRPRAPPARPPPPAGGGGGGGGGGVAESSRASAEGTKHRLSFQDSPGESPFSHSGVFASIHSQTPLRQSQLLPGALSGLQDLPQHRCPWNPPHLKETLLLKKGFGNMDSETFPEVYPYPYLEELMGLSG